MPLKKREHFYLWAFVLLAAFFAFSVVFVYRYLSNNLVIGDAASQWVTVDFTDSSVIDSSKTTAFWNQTAGYVEAAIDESAMSRVVYADQVHYGGGMAVSPNYDSDHTMIVCPFIGCYKTTNSGQSWNLVLDDFILYVKYSPDFANDDTLIAIGYYGVFVSTDAGNTWTKSSRDVIAYMGSLEFSPDFANDSTVYAASFTDGLYRSLDGGLTWTKLTNLSVYSVISVVLSPDFANDDTLWISSQGEGIYKSTDRGVNWVAVNSGLADLSTGTMVVSPDFVNDDTLFAAGIDTANRLYKSTDGGANWVDLGLSVNGEADHVLWKLFISPDFANDQRILVTDFTGRYLWYSDDAGTTWQSSNLNTVIGPVFYYNQISTDSSIVASANYATDHTLWMVSLNKKGFLKSTNGGANWTWQNLDRDGLFTANPSKVVFAPDYESSNELWVVDYYLGPFVSDDNGASWTARSSGLEHYQPTSNYDDFSIENFFFSPNYANDNTLFLIITAMVPDDEIIYKSTNRGVSWSTVALPAAYTPWLNRMAFSPDYANDGTILMGTSAEGLLRSTDFGETWADVAGAPVDRFNGLSFGLDVNEYYLAGHSALYYSDDAGASFTSNAVGLNRLADLILDENYATNGKLYTISYRNEFATVSDNGATVSVSSNGLPVDVVHYGMTDISISPNYLADGTFILSGTEDDNPELGPWPYAGFNQKAVLYQSFDNGATWSQLNNEFMHYKNSIYNNAISPYFADRKEFWLSVNNEGLYRSFDYSSTTVTVESTILKEASGLIKKARVVATASNESAGTVAYYVSSDGGYHWTVAPNNQEVTISDHPGNQLVWRATIKSTDGQISPRIESVQIFYELAAGAAPPIYSSEPSISFSNTDVADYSEFADNIVNIEIYNENYDEVIMSNHEDLLSDGLNKDSGQWINFGFENIYQNWILEEIDNSAIYMRFRREAQSGYAYSNILVLPGDELGNSRELTSDVKAYQEGVSANLNTITQGFNTLRDYPGQVRYTCDYDYEKFHIVPYLRNSVGEWFAGNLKAGSLTVYEFPGLAYPLEITMKMIGENNYEFIVNRVDKEAHFELWMRQYYDDLVIREDFVLADTWVMYQQPKQQEILLVDLCHYLRSYKNNNYIEVYSQPNYQGFKQTIYANVHNFSYEYIGDNNIASIKSFGNVNTVLYSEADYKGKKFEFQGDVNNFNGTSVGNDNISSLKLIYLPLGEKLSLTESFKIYLDASETSEVLEKAWPASDYEIVWQDGVWYKIKFSNGREGWVLQNK